ncbi:hypothetical protein ACE6H2_017932 [Prunus campanulata]
MEEKKTMKVEFLLDQKAPMQKRWGYMTYERPYALIKENLSPFFFHFFFLSSLFSWWL